MSWNNGGGPTNPWGNPGGGGGRPPPRPDRGPDKGGPDRGPDRGPWGKGGGAGSLPDLDELIARMQDKARRFVPGGGNGGRGGGGGFGRGNGRLLAVLGLVAVAIWLGSGFYRVQPDEQGVVLRFGAYDGRTTAPGLRYHLPWPIEQAFTPSVTTTNSVEIGFRSNGNGNGVARISGRNIGTAQELPEEALMLTGDENIIDINFSVFWRIRNAGDYLFNIQQPNETVRAAAESMMRQVMGRTPIQPALAEARARIEADVAAGTQAILDQYHAGVEIVQVQLQRVDPPAAVIDSFRDVQRAITEAEQARNEAESYRNSIIPRARGDAARITAEAEGARQASIAEAIGQAQRFQSVYSAYILAKDVTLKRLYIETMQEILQHTPATIVDDQLKGVVPFLPIDPGKTDPGKVDPNKTDAGKVAAMPAPLGGTTR